MGSIVAMVPADSGVEQTSGAVPRLDPESAGWLRVLAGTGPAREAALGRLHEMLVRIARGEVGRRARGCSSPAPSSMTWPTKPPLTR